MFRVNSLAWDSASSTLFIGGAFHAIDDLIISSGLAMWTKYSGLVAFPGGGVLNSDGGVSNTQVKSILFEPNSQVSG